MIFVLFVKCICYFQDSNKFKQYYFLKPSESDCIFDKTYNESIYSNSAICLIRCVFKSIKTTSEGGAIVISLRNRFGNNIIIDNCTFTKCSSKCGAAIFINLEKNCTIEINNSIFDNNSETDKGTIYIISKIKCNLELQNSTFIANSAVTGGCSIYCQFLNFSIKNTKFINNSLIQKTNECKGAAVYSIDSTGLLIKCIFTNNYANNEHGKSYAGAIFFDKTKCMIKDCVFANNKAYSYSSNYLSSGASCGGAIYAIESSESFENCKFINNSAVKNPTYQSNAFGGAISFSKTNGTFTECIFINNSVHSESHQSFGGAISFSGSFGNLEMCTFSNNSACSMIDNAYGGAIYFPSGMISLINNLFTDNFAYSVSKNSFGGAIFVKNGDGPCFNCTFNINTAKTFLSEFLISGDEPHSLGGAIYLSLTSINFTHCSFYNNTGFGRSPKHVCTGRGGAIYSDRSNIEINQSLFNNNTLCNYGYKFDIDCYIEGGACYFVNSNARIFDCDFINNTAMLYSSEHSIYFSARLYGGAIFSYSTKQSFICKNCLFKNNLVHIPNYEEKEFAGAVCLTNGTLENCSFIDNIAYNGGDIRYNQNNCSFLEILKCNFTHNNFFNHQIKSLIHFRGSHNISSVNNFAYNKIIINISTTLFDGDMLINDDSTRKVQFKFAFNNNCMSPLEQKYFITDNFYIYDENGEKAVDLSSSIESDCDEYVDPQTLPIITRTEQIITPTKTPTEIITTQIITPTKTSLIPTEITKTQTITPTKSITHTDKIITPTKSEQIITLTETWPIYTQTETVYTQSEFIETTSNTIITQTDEVTTTNNQNDFMKFKTIFIIQTAIFIFLTILVLIVLILLICYIKKNNQTNFHSNLNSTLLDVV